MPSNQIRAARVTEVSVSNLKVCPLSVSLPPGLDTDEVRCTSLLACTDTVFSGAQSCPSQSTSAQFMCSSPSLSWLSLHTLSVRSLSLHTQPSPHESPSLDVKAPAFTSGSHHSHSFLGL